MMNLGDIGPRSHANGVREVFNSIIGGVVLLLLLPPGLPPLTKPDSKARKGRTSSPRYTCNPKSAQSSREKSGGYHCKGPEVCVQKSWPAAASTSSYIAVSLC